MVIPIIPVLSTKWEGRSTVRTLLEVMHWFVSTTDTEAILMRGIIQGYISTNLSQRSVRGWADGGRAAGHLFVSLRQLVML